MSYRISIVLSLFLLSIFWNVDQLGAQHLLIEQSIVEYEDITYPCVVVRMDPLPKEVKKAWDDYLQDHYDINLKGIGFLSNKDVLSAENVSFPEVSEEPISFYTRVVEKGVLTEMSVFAHLEEDTVLDPAQFPQEFSRLQNIVEDFIGYFLPNHYQELVLKTEESLQDLIDEREDLTEDISDNRKKIADLEKENIRKNRQLTEVEDKIESMNTVLKARREKLQKIDLKVSKERKE